MRAGGCTVQQTLTQEAANVVRCAVNLARQRGHAQVTPVHVAHTLLQPEGAGMGILRKACIKSHPDSTKPPVQCRALELCFGVALHRIPSSAGGFPNGQPALSNALVAALKRAQAHQRRGCLEHHHHQHQQQQQQPLLTVKVEMEQLIISILDDPSVSRVMREAGFSSTCVKNNLEEAISASVLPVAFQSPHQQQQSSQAPTSFRSPAFGFCYNNVVGLADNSGWRPAEGNVKKEDVQSVVEVMLRKRRRNTVIVGDGLQGTENVVRELKVQVERGDVPEPLKGARFLPAHFSNFPFQAKEELQQKLSELRKTINGYLSAGISAIIYVGDLRWIIEKENDCAVQFIVLELGRILAEEEGNKNARVWLTGTASFQTYSRCRTRQPSLETIWGLQAVPVPSSGLDLSLHSFPSSADKRDDDCSDVVLPVPQSVRWPMQPALKTINSDNEESEKLSCCSECMLNFQREAMLPRNENASPRPDLPPWLQPLKTGNTDAQIKQLRIKWNQTCRVSHSQSASTDDTVQYLGSRDKNNNNVNIPWWLCQSSAAVKSTQQHQQVSSLAKPTLDLGLQRPSSDAEAETNGVLPLSLAFQSSSTQDFQSSPTDSRDSDSAKAIAHHSGDAKALLERLAKSAPWQSENNLRDLAMIVCDCRAARLRRHGLVKSDVWILLSGSDTLGKKKLAQALARSVFGSADRLLTMSLVDKIPRLVYGDVSCRAKTQTDWDWDVGCRGKTQTDLLVRFLCSNPHSVLLLQEVDDAEPLLLDALSNAMERGKISDSQGRDFRVSESLILIDQRTSHTPLGTSSGPRMCSENATFALRLIVQEEETGSMKLTRETSLKRKTTDSEDDCEAEETAKRRHETKKLNLDLNLDAKEQHLEDEDEEREYEDEDDGSSSGKSDLTQDNTTVRLKLPTEDQRKDKAWERLMNKVDKVVDVRACPASVKQIGESLLSEISEAYKRACNSQGCLRVDESAVECMARSFFFAMEDADWRTLVDRWVSDTLLPSFARIMIAGHLNAKCRVTLETVVPPQCTVPLPLMLQIHDLRPSAQQLTSVL